MKKSFMIASIVALGGLSMLQTACDNYDDLVPQEYNCILSLQQYGEQDVVLYRTGEDTKFVITTLKTGNVPTSTASATVSPMSEVQFAEYQVTTGKNYKYLPQECYSINDGELAYGSDDKWMKSVVNINFDKASTLVEQSKGEYVIPILLSSENDSCLSSRRELILKLADVVVPKVSMVNSGTNEVKTTGGIITIPLQLQIENQWDFRAKVALDGATTTLQNINLVAGSESSANEVWVNFTKGGNAEVQISISGMTDVSGKVGLKIVELEGADFAYDETPIVVNVKIEKYKLTPEMLFSNAVEPSEGSLANLLDENPNTFFHSAWSVAVNGTHYVQVTLPEPISEFAFSYANRNTNANAALYGLKVYAGNDESNMSQIGWFTWDNPENPLPWNIPGGVFESHTIRLSEPCKIFRFDNDGSMGGAFFVWSEFSMRVLK